MAESDASESSVLEDFNLSDQIDAELSEEGGSICQAESVPVQPYRHEPYRPDSGEEPGPEEPGPEEPGPEEPTDNDQPAEPEGGRTVSNLSGACKTLSGTHFYDTFNAFYCIQNGYKVTIEQPVSGVGINEFHRRL